MAPSEDRNRVLTGECISRARVEAAGAAELAAIDDAIGACDYEQAALLAMARAKAKLAIPIEVIARIVPGIEFPAITCALIALAEGDRVEPLLGVLERRRFPQTKDSAELEAIVLYAAWRGGAPTKRVIPELRRLSIRPMTADGYALLATIAQAIDQPNVAAVTKSIAPFAKEYAKQVASDDRALRQTIAETLAALPAEVETPRAAGFTVRSTKQVGRNDPCPCGSGLKYKKCCADKPQASDAAPSPIPGVSWTEFLAGDRLTPEHVADLALRDLARVDLARLADKSLAMACRRFTEAHEWTRATAALELLDGREEIDDTGISDSSDWRWELVNRALECGELELARDHIAKLPAEFADEFALDLAIADTPANAWTALVAAAGRVLRSEDKLADVGLAYSLLRASPELGILAARACIGTLRVDSADTLLEAVEDARDRLDLPPNDPAWDVLDELTEKDESAPDDADDLRAALHESGGRIDQLERTIAALRTELDAARTLPAAGLQRAPEAGALDVKIRELEAVIRERNAERLDLRRQLQNEARGAARLARTAEDSPRARRVTMDEPDEGFDDEAPAGSRSVTLPRFDRRFTDALADVPTAVASEAMRTIGTLAAGDGFAWRAAKQAKDMVRQVLMARVGIHHRLLFRVEDGGLDVLDLITREQLMTTLKRLRGAR